MSSDPAEFEAYRPLLFSIAYRMLGTAMEAEDMVQETYLRYKSAGKQDIHSPKAYLTTIITRLCLDYLKSARAQRENYVGTWLPEPILTGGSLAGKSGAVETLTGEPLIGRNPEAIVGERESISMAFLVLLQSLSPTERAVFLLREVFDYSYAEIAHIVDKSEANCRRYYHRARQFIAERRPRFEPSRDEQQKLVDGFLQAITSGDVDRLTHLLAEDVTLYGDGGGKVPSVPRPLEGRERVMRLLFGIYHRMPPDARAEIVEVNGSPAVVVWGPDRLYGLASLVFEGGRVKTLYHVLNPDKLAHVSR